MVPADTIGAFYGFWTVWPPLERNRVRGVWQMVGRVSRVVRRCPCRADNVGRGRRAMPHGHIVPVLDKDGLVLRAVRGDASDFGPVPAEPVVDDVPTTEGVAGHALDGIAIDVPREGRGDVRENRDRRIAAGVMFPANAIGAVDVNPFQPERNRVWGIGTPAPRRDGNHLAPEGHGSPAVDVDDRPVAELNPVALGLLVAPGRPANGIPGLPETVRAIVGQPAHKPYVRLLGLFQTDTDDLPVTGREDDSL